MPLRTSLWAVLALAIPAHAQQGDSLARSAAGAGQLLLVEAEGFADTGGWVVDPQFMDQMGSPYLLAHGLGVPVADAVTTFEVREAGIYRVFVRTKDWVARWNAPGTPGRFQVLVDGRPLATTFGTVGADWHWQTGGEIALEAGTRSLALHDLTGFEGRCDAILFVRDEDFVPPNADPEMAAFRRTQLGIPEEPVPAGEYDFVVTGGGIAGTCAALTAARLGLRVALIQDRPVLGGNNSSEVRVWLQGARNMEPWPHVGDVVAELEQDQRAHYGPSNTADLYEDGKKLRVVRAEPNIDLFLEHRGNGVEMEEGRIRAVLAQDIRSGRRIRVGGRLFADCTGDAVIGALAGADFDLKEEGRMGPCNLWNVCECEDTSPLGSGTAVAAEPAPFPRCPWALDLSDKPFPGRSGTKPDPDKLGGWYWESGFDRDPIAEMEYVRDWNFRAMYGAWDALKNVDRVLPNHRLNWSAYILGKRESRRLLGDVVLTLDDLEQDRVFQDGCAPTGWSNDLHVPDPRYEAGFEGDAFISTANHGQYPARAQNRSYWIPYRCLYSRNVDNLLMAGRNISVTHEALGAVRVMRTCGTEGEIVGMAASLCRKFDVSPRGVYEEHLGALQDLMRKGAGKLTGAEIAYINQGLRYGIGEGRAPIRIPDPDWLVRAGDNLARAATVRIEGESSGEVQSGMLLNDGVARLEDNDGRLVLRAALPHVLEFAWDEPTTIGAARVISGYNENGKITAPLADFELHWHDGDTWRPAMLPARTNTHPAWSRTFDAVRTNRVRLVVTKTKGDVSRIWEVELYGPVSVADNRPASRR